MFISSQNIFSGQSIIIKAVVKNKKITQWILIELKSYINIIGAFDMNMDGLVDLLYIDKNNNVSQAIIFLNLLYFDLDFLLNEQRSLLFFSAYFNNKFYL